MNDGGDVRSETAPLSECTCPPGDMDSIRHDEGCPCRRGQVREGSLVEQLQNLRIESNVWRGRHAEAEAEVERLTRDVERESTHNASLELEIKRLREVLGRLLHISGRITPDTPCICGATQPAHYCEHEVQARQDAFALIGEPPPAEEDR